MITLGTARMADHPLFTRASPNRFVAGPGGSHFQSAGNAVTTTVSTIALANSIRMMPNRSRLPVPMCTIVSSQNDGKTYAMSGQGRRRESSAQEVVCYGG